MKIVIYYSSRTGNTKKLAEALSVSLAGSHTVSLIKTAEAGEPVEADLYLLSFWCRKSGMDDLSLRLLEKFTGKRILAAGTIGGDAEGAYGRRVCENVRASIEKANFCAGVFVCRGAVDLARIRKRMALPETDPHYVGEEKYRKYLLTQSHPDENDLRRVAEYVSACLARLKSHETEE